MIGIKTTQIDGDVSVGRNVALGGKARVAGSATIGHNLKVEGWLEAPNIKDINNKGLFASSSALGAAYPTPRVGWWAMVGDSSPFAIYRCNSAGTWTATGGTASVSLTIDAETIAGWVSISSTSELPEDPTDDERGKGYLLGTVLYVYVGTGGDTLDGLYQSAQLKGQKGDTGNTVQLGEAVIADNLTTDDAEKVLSAKQGKVLKGLIDNIEIPVVNDLTTGGEGNALSAEMGKVLKNEFDGATQITGVASTTGYHVFSINGTLRAESSASYTAPINVTKGQIIKVVVSSTLNTNYVVIAKVLTADTSYQNKVKYVNNQSTYIWIADEDCQIAISFKTTDGYRAYIMTDTIGLWDNVMELKALEPKVDNLTDAIDVNNYTLISRIVAADSVASWGNRNTIVGCDKAFSQRSLLDKVKMFIYSPEVGSVVKFYLGKIDQRNWLLPRLTFTAYVTSLEEISLGDKTSVIDLSSYHIIAEEGEVLFFSPQPTTSKNATFGWSIPATIPNVTFYKTSDINTALETDSRGIRWFEITAKSVETYLALETDVEKINTAIEQQAESIANSKIYYDRTTGEAYKIIVNNGAIQLKSASVNSLLVLGHSYAAYGEAGIWQCNDNRGMAATIAANDYPAQMKAILGASTLSKMNVADWERNLINYNFASNWGVTDVYDAIVLFVGANIVDTSNVYQGYVEALTYLKQAAPTADIYVASMSIGAIYDGAKNAASAMKVDFIDITYLSKYPLMHLMGDYYIGKNSTYYDITAGGVANHPADYGHWLIAQAITLGMGNETNADPTHNITLMQAVGGSISACALLGVEGGVITIHCSADEGYAISSIAVVDGSGTAVTATARSGVYTFIMPSSDVTVTPTWVAE